MRSRRPNTLEVHVSFEVNRRARAHLIDAYQLLVPTASKRKPAATEPTPTSRRAVLVPVPKENVG